MVAGCPRGNSHQQEVVAAKGLVFEKAEAKAHALLTEPAEWQALHKSGRCLGMAAMAFAMISTFVCAIDQVLLHSWRAWPYRTFLLLTEAARDDTVTALLAAPACLLDEWTRRFRKVFHTRALLLSSHCRALLTAMSLIARWGICRLECRNALLRRLSA